MEATLRMISALGALNRASGKAGVFTGSVLIVIMTVLVILGVFFRYVLNNSLTWVEDVALIMMVTTAFLIAPFAYRNGANVAIEMVISALPQAAVRLLRLIINLLVLWVIYRYFFESLKLVERGWGIRVNTVPIPWAIPYLIVPVAFASMALVAIELIARDIWALAFGSNTADLPHMAPVEPE
ncbi:MAG: TRAP transporter small permease subunit [Rhizobiaceae bacterium]